MPLPPEGGPRARGSRPVIRDEEVFWCGSCSRHLPVRLRVRRPTPTPRCVECARAAAAARARRVKP